ncbi:hypothetical protein HDU90_008943, partial [Geranomyces variabilis]
AQHSQRHSKQNRKKVDYTIQTGGSAHKKAKTNQKENNGEIIETIEVEKRVYSPATTPAWLADLIKKFTSGVDLDPCSDVVNPVGAKVQYGCTENGGFIDAVALQDWEANTNVVYLNPPATYGDKQPTQSLLSNRFWNKCLDEASKGNVQRMIGLVPRTSRDTSRVLKQALVCFVDARADFDATIIAYLNTDDSYPYAAKFVATFQHIGYIPGAGLCIFKPPRDHWRLRYFSICSGIGVAETAIQTVFPTAECVGYTEIDEAALKIYKKHFPNHKCFGNVLDLDIDDMPFFDVIIGGTPCQPFSKLGQIHNTVRDFDHDDSKPTSKFIEIVKKKAPRHFLLENTGFMCKGPRDHISTELAERYMDDFKALLKKNVIGDEDFAQMKDLRKRLLKIFKSLYEIYVNDKMHYYKVGKLDCELDDLVYEMNFLKNL